jgi:hypothetical protein
MSCCVQTAQTRFTRQRTVCRKTLLARSRAFRSANVHMEYACVRLLEMRALRDTRSNYNPCRLSEFYRSSSEFMSRRFARRFGGLFLEIHQFTNDLTAAT